MRLLSVETLKLHEFFEEDIPPYSILSHRWGKDEVSYHDFINGHKTDGDGLKKIREVCAVVNARKTLDDIPGYDPYAVGWIWIDTCCIDKTSSSELSEAINSMYEWYSNAQECIVYLADVPSPDYEYPPEHSHSSILSRSEWFTRGWTLQELLAPRVKVFYSSSWQVIGHTIKSHPRFVLQSNSEVATDSWIVDKNRVHGNRSTKDYFGRDISSLVSQVTGIQIEYLTTFRNVNTASVATRMSWASARRTTRREDIAYCLIGLFDVNMPLLYGEGSKAFLRLQEGIIKRSSDQSIFAWCNLPPIPGAAAVLTSYEVGLLAYDIRAFRYAHDIERFSIRPKRPYSMTNLGLQMHIKSRIATVMDPDPSCVPHIVALAGICDAHFDTIVIIMLRCLHDRQRMWYRSHTTDLFMSGVVSGRIHIPSLQQETETDSMEVFAAVDHTNVERCPPCVDFDRKLQPSLMQLAFQQGLLDQDALNRNPWLSPGSQISDHRR